jgi:hypothetical protein
MGWIVMLIVVGLFPKFGENIDVKMLNNVI